MFYVIISKETYPDENTLTLAPRSELFACAYRLDLDLPHIKQQIATIIAIKNIIPRIQNANANFDVDKHNVPSDCVPRIRAEYSLTIRKIKI